MERAGADEAIRLLLAAGMVDPTRKMRDEGDVLIPVRDAPGLAEWAARLGARIVEEPPLQAREGRRSPRELVVNELQERGLPASLLQLVPDKWEQHGDVLVLRMPAELRAHERDVAAAFARVLSLKSVLVDDEGVRGELREMSARLVWGSDPIATHAENGIAYRFDAARVMFSSGNVAERMRVGQLPARGETVVDMFAGIGYFTIPLALHAGAARVHALEKNPVSHRFLVENAKLNGVESVVEPWLGDNREFPLEGVADRVMMGYFPGTREFLPKAFRLLKPSGGVLHYHDTAHERTWRDELTRAVLDGSRACGRVVAIRDARVVKTHSPGVVHAVLDVDVRA